MSEWHPIETAPKDGTEILVYAYVSHWCKQDRQIAVIARFDGYVWNSNLCCEPTIKPTHWMPLPVPPKESKEDE